MMRRLIGLLLTLALGILAAPLTADVQQSTNVHRIGRLSAASPAAGPDPLLEAFQQGRHDLGYIQGQNLVIEARCADGREERLPDLAAELVRLNVEVMVAGGTAATSPHSRWRAGCQRCTRGECLWSGGPHVLWAGPA